MGRSACGPPPCPPLRDRVPGLAGADSWTTDAHKWLNVPYDSGIVIVRDAAAHHAAMTLGAAYYVETAGGERDNYNWVPESSRRARGFPVYAALQSLGRTGLAEMIARCCALARRMADRLRAAEGVTILNDVVLNQVLVRFSPPGSAVGGGSADDAATDDFTRRVIAAVQADGTCWLGGTTWHGMAAMRISVSNWSTTEADADVSVDAILRCARAVADQAAAARRGPSRPHGAPASRSLWAEVDRGPVSSAEQGVDLALEVLDALEALVHAGEPDVGDLVERRAAWPSRAARRATTAPR